MESQQQGHSVQIEMEKLNGEQSAEPVPSHSSLCLKRGIILVSMVGLLAICITSLLFTFVFWPVCGQDTATPSATLPATPQTTEKVNLTCRLQALKQKTQYDIFQVEKPGKYFIHGWLNRSTDVREDVELVHIYDSQTGTLKTNNNPEFMLYFNTEVLLNNGSRVSLRVSQLTDGFFYLYEL